MGYKCKYCGSTEIFGWKGGEMICLNCGHRWWDRKEKRAERNMNYTEFLVEWFEEHYNDGMLKDEYEWVD